MAHFCQKSHLFNIYSSAHVNPATGKFEFHQNSASTMKDGHADGAMVNWRNRAVIIGGTVIYKYFKKLSGYKLENSM